MVVKGWTACAAFALLAACTSTPGADLGDACDRDDDCAESAQCFHQVCTPRCGSHDDCGGGYVCEADGTCERVVSQIGDPCARELDCGPRQSCQLDDVDHDGDGWLAATCQVELAGNIAGTACGADTECATGICSLGRCSEVCAAGDDCRPTLDCVDMPRLLPDGAPLFRGCLQGAGRLELAVESSNTGDPVRVPVPGNALSFSVTSQVDDPRLFVGAHRVEAPDGTVLYAGAMGGGDVAIRYRPQKRISTLLIPNAPQVPVAVGAYTMTIAASHGNGDPAAERPDIHVVYKLGGELTASIVDLNLYFLDLADHPCPVSFDEATIDASIAASSPAFQLYLLALQDTLTAAGVSIGDITYQDLTGHPELDALAPAELGALLTESNIDGGVNVFFVRSIDPIGVQALSGATPGPSGIAGTPASGIAVSIETLCYRGWGDLARSTAHAVGSQLGLYRNVEPDGTPDVIVDSPDDDTNLMHFSEFGGTSLSQGQSAVLRNNPVTRTGATEARTLPAFTAAPLGRGELVPVGDRVEPTAVTPDGPLRDLLGGIDFVPAREHLDPMLGGDPAASLLALAIATADMDRGVRLRAFRALEHYPDDATTAALTAEVTARRDAHTGVEILYLHAAMRSLGAAGGDAAVDPIRPLLDHDGKDTRAAAAAALGATGSKLARDPLYERLAVETDEMVRLALTDAIRRLDDVQQ